jgi:hypothetical protein
MKRFVMRMAAAVAVTGCMLAIAGCCGGGNASKTAACKASKTSEECKTCCGGNYSFVGSTPDSCTCF